ncbi:radical SAM protein [Candidatus Woesearchaeota archaeon]|nr:radical SAM protein [Candidatus Woesearchaeota archaeon]
MHKKIYYSFRKNSLKNPIYLIFFVTNSCNARCNHCFYSNQLNINQKDILTLEQINDFSKQLGKIVWLAISGGEPFLRNDLEKIYELFCDNNKIEDLNLPTNGVLTDVIYEKAKYMLNSRKIKNFNIVLSLDGTKEIHNQIRGIDCFENVFKTYEKLIELKKDHSNLLIKVNTTLSNNNIHVIPDLIKYVHEKMPGIDFHNFEIMRGNPKNPSYLPPTTEQLEEIKPLIFKTWEHYAFFGKKDLKSKIAINAKKFLFNSYIKTLKEKRQLFPCYAGKVHAVLDYNGDIFLCELGPKIGNIKEQSFKEVWNSENANIERKKIMNKECYCTHSCFQNTNVSFNQKLWPKLFFGD